MSADPKKVTLPKKTTILHVILSLEIGGMEQVVADLVRNLDRERFHTVVACLESLGPIAEDLKANGVTVLRLPPMIPIVSFLYPAPLLRIIRETKASIVHTHSGCFYKTAIACRLSGVETIIYTEHGRQFPDRKLVIGFDRIFFRLASRVVAVSPELADYLWRIVGVPREKITVIRNGISVDAFNRPSDSTPRKYVVIGIIARLAPVKDIATLLRAMELVVRECPDTQLQIVGDGPERGALEQLCEALGLTKHVTFLGFRRDIPALLAGMDIFVLSSLSEGTSITILEAMASGKPVVVTRVGSNPAIVENQRNGFVVSPRHPTELAEALTHLIKNPELRDSFGALNRRKALEGFSIATMARQYEALYDNSQPVTGGE